MTKPNQEKERERLKRLYAGMSDAELEKIASERGSLADIAREVLEKEMSGREISWPVETTVDHPKPVMIRRFRDLPDATIARSILESAGIKSFLADDNLVRLDWFYSNLVGGVKLFVTEADADLARTLLDEPPPEKFAVDGIGEYRQPRCPRCASLDVSFDGLDKRSSYASLLVGVPVPITNKGGKCHACGHRWTDDQASETLDG